MDQPIDTDRPGTRAPGGRRSPVAAPFVVRAVVVAMAGIMPAGALFAQAPATPPAAERPAPDPWSGRWSSANGRVTFDIGRCGDEWCGIRVSPEGHCGDLALRLHVNPAEPAERVLEGHLDRRPGADRHAVTTSLHRDVAGGPVTLRIVGEPGDRLQFFRRVFPYSDRWLRAGEASCRAEAKTS